MGYFGEYKNSSNCADPTAYKALNAECARPGEIWSRKWAEDEEFLIIKNHGSFCTTLKLTDEAVAAGIAVVSKRKRYTNPAMVGYTFNSTLGEFVKTLPPEQFETVLLAVEDALEIKLTAATAVPMESVQRETEEEVERLMSEHKKKWEELEKPWVTYETWESNMNGKLEAERRRADKAEGKLELLREMYNNLLRETMMGKEEAT